MAAAHGNADRRFRQVRGHGCCDGDVLRRIRGRSCDLRRALTRTSREHICCVSVLREIDGASFELALESLLDGLDAKYALLQRTSE